MYAKLNLLYLQFGICSPDVLYNLFNSYCMSLYGSFCDLCYTVNGTFMVFTIKSLNIFPFHAVIASHQGELHILHEYSQE